MALLHKALEPPVAAQFIGGFRGAALEKNCGLTNPIPAEMFNVSTENREWVNRRCVPQALATFEMPILLSGKIENVKRRLYFWPTAGTPVRSANCQVTYWSAGLGRYQDALRARCHGRSPERVGRRRRKASVATKSKTLGGAPKPADRSRSLLLPIADRERPF